MVKVKGRERILKAAREKQSAKYKGILLRLSAVFSTETLQDRRVVRYTQSSTREKCAA